ncbi:MAG: alpha/beta hydrolase [Clostridiales bacterium]|nr:alpha/beta hydrolase [Clostridiales bacterium]
MYEVNYLSVIQNDEYITEISYFQCDIEPKASLLILHGMAEHKKRYYPFAEYLTEKGIDVYIYNHRGHGTDKKIRDLGFFAAENGHQLVIEDAITVSKHIKRNNRCNRFLLMGHSMGSLIARNVIQTYDEYDGVILSGTSFPANFLTTAGLLISSILTIIKGPKHISPFLNKLIFGNKKYTDLTDRTIFDWLSRSHTSVGAYIHDPYCGFICTSSFYRDLLKLVRNASIKKRIQKTNNNLPIFIISGDKDPVGGYGKDIKNYLSILNKLQFTNVSSKLYPDCRHELINEINKEEVYNDILQWIDKVI